MRRDAKFSVAVSHRQFQLTRLREARPSAIDEQVKIIKFQLTRLREARLATCRAPLTASSFQLTRLREARPRPALYLFRLLHLFQLTRLREARLDLINSSGVH